MDRTNHAGKKLLQLTISQRQLDFYLVNTCEYQIDPNSIFVFWVSCRFEPWRFGVWACISFCGLLLNGRLFARVGRWDQFGEGRAYQMAQQDRPTMRIDWFNWIILFHLTTILLEEEEILPKWYRIDIENWTSKYIINWFEWISFEIQSGFRNFSAITINRLNISKLYKYH